VVGVGGGAVGIRIDNADDGEPVVELHPLDVQRPEGFASTRSQPRDI
jgi:hypothetical protein